MLDSAIQWINHYPRDKYYGNQVPYPLDRDLSSNSIVHLSNNSALVTSLSSSESQLRVGMDLSPHVRESGFRNPRNFCSWHLESWALQTVIQLKESGIPLPIGIQNPSSTDKEWTPVPGIRNPEPETVLDFLTWGEIYEFIFHYKL